MGNITLLMQMIQNGDLCGNSGSEVTQSNLDMLSNEVGHDIFPIETIVGGNGDRYTAEDIHEKFDLSSLYISERGQFVYIPYPYDSTWLIHIGASDMDLNDYFDTVFIGSVYEDGQNYFIWYIKRNDYQPELPEEGEAFTLTSTPIMVGIVENPVM